MSLRVVQVVHKQFPSVGGIEKHVYELQNNLDADVKVISPGRFSFKLPFFSFVIIAPLLPFRLWKEEADIYCSHGYGSLMPFYTAIVAWLKRKPFVFTIHGYPSGEGFKRFALWFYEQTFARVILAVATKVIAVTPIPISKELNIIGNGVYEMPYCGDGDCLVYVGRLDKDKRVDWVVRAGAKLGRKVLIVGPDDGAKEELKELANLLGADVEFMEVHPDKISSVYARASAVVLPSKYEGFSLVWLEAMGSGVPVFSTPVGEAPSLFSKVYGQSAINYIFTNEGRLVRCLRKERNEKVLRRAREKIQKDYRWSIVAEKTMEVYRDACEVYR